MATASLELGIDIGTVDLVCQIGSPRSIAVALQRIGRSGHWVGAMPKGRLFATTRDELIECAALVRAIRAGELDRLEIPRNAARHPGAADRRRLRRGGLGEDELFELVRAPSPTATCRGRFRRRGRHALGGHRDGARTQRRVSAPRRGQPPLRGRRGARLAAITSGGAIPDTANYLVVAEPEGTIVGTVDEDFAVESLAGDVFLLGTTSWRIRRVEAGRVRVEDAHGAAPSIPFWRGEAPGRTVELSREVSRAARGDRVARRAPRNGWRRSAGWIAAAREQAVDYVRDGPRGAGRAPDDRTPSSPSASSTRAAACSWSCTRRSARASTAPGGWRCASASAARSTSSCRRRPPTTAS